MTRCCRDKGIWVNWTIPGVWVCLYSRQHIMYSPLCSGSSRRCRFNRCGGWWLLLFLYGQLYQFLLIQRQHSQLQWQQSRILKKKAIQISSITKGPTFTPSSTALMTLVTDATFSLSSKSMPSSITWSAHRIRLARLWYTRLWQEESAELLKELNNKVRNAEECEKANGSSRELHWRWPKMNTESRTPCTLPSIYHLLNYIHVFRGTFVEDMRICLATDLKVGIS